MRMRREMARRRERDHASGSTARSHSGASSESAWGLPTPRFLDVAAGVAALVVLAVYVATLNPTVSHGDTGEMIVVPFTLGVAHPPGFPLYTVLAKIATLVVPVGGIAWRLNFFSALANALAAFLACRAAGRWSGSAWGGVMAAGLFAFSPLVWPYAVTAEVFALNNFFVALLLEVTSKAATGTDAATNRRRLVALMFVFGLGLSNHPILLMIGGPVVAWHLFRFRSSLRHPWQAAALVLAFVLGLLPYGYLLLAPRFGSTMIWGDTGTITGFLHHVLRTEYGTFQLASGPAASLSDAMPRALAFAERFARTTFGIGPLLLVTALAALVRPSRVRATALPWAAAAVFHLAAFSLLSNLSIGAPVAAAVQQRFWQQSVLVLAMCASLGLGVLGRWLEPMSRLLVPIVAVGVPAVLAAVHFPAMDQRTHVYFREYGRAILAPLPKDAILLITSDEAVGSVRYLQTVESLRPDVLVLPAGQIANEWFPKLAARQIPRLLLPAGNSFTFAQFLGLNLPRARVFLVNKIPWEQTLEGPYAVWPVGLADEVLPSGVQPVLDAWVDQSLASFTGFDPAAHGRIDGAWERYVADAYWKQVDRFGSAVARTAITAGGAEEASLRVVRALEPLLEKHPAPLPEMFRNLGVAYQFLSARRPDARERMVFYWRRYLEKAPANAPDRALIQQALAQAEARQPQVR